MKKGFTLIELMITVAILAILTTITIPGMNQALKKAKDSTVLNFLAAVRSKLTMMVPDKAMSDKIYPDKIEELSVYTTATKIEKSDTTIGIGDSITKYEVKAGRARKGGIISKGTALSLAGVDDVVEIIYDNTTGLIYIEGIGDIDYRDTKGGLWNKY